MAIAIKDKDSKQVENRKEGLTNKYIEEFGLKHCKDFLGVFPSDIQPVVKNLKSFSIIFNESEHDEEGSHFVCVFLKNGKCYYFDSLGLKLENENIITFLKKYINVKVIENNIQIQSFESLFCGYYCLSFLIFLSKGFDIRKYFKNLIKKI